MIVALVGPTASGKSDLALKLAQESRAEILSCDSLLVYRGMNIGTAKPSEEERHQARHHAIDILDPNEPFTAGDFVRYARPILDECVKSKKPLLIVGGTGFYLKALLFGVWDAPPTNLEIRARLEKEAPETLYAILEKADPEYAPKIKANDRYRVIRALEIIESSGKTVTEMLQGRTLQNPLPYPFTVLGIKRQKVDLERRIIARTNQMFEKGIVNETKAMLAKYREAPRPFHCVGYSEVMDHLAGKMTLPECRERIIISTRQLAKKQMTFFKTFPGGIQWFMLPTEEEELLATARKALKA